MTNDRHSTILAILLAAAAIMLGLVLLNRWQRPPVAPTVTPSRTSVPVVSPTLTTVPQTATATMLPPAPIVTDAVTPTATDNPTVIVPPVVPTLTPAWKVVRLCHPRQWWQACYWRCCDGQ